MKNDNLKFKIINSIMGAGLILAIFIIFVPLAYGARVYFEPPPATYKVGEGFTLVLLLDTEGQPINAIDISIQVPKLLKIKNISKSGSVIQLWVNEPSFSGDIINLIGGVPGGTTTSKGIIAKITFEAAAIGEGNIAFKPGSLVLLNDGQGTQLDLKTAGGPVFNIVPKPKEIPKKKELEPQPEFKETKDNKKPEGFSVLTGEDSRIFSGQKFISFFTTDKDSGVDRYEVKEG